MAKKEKNETIYNFRLYFEEERRPDLKMTINIRGFLVSHYYQRLKSLYSGHTCRQILHKILEF